MSTWLLSVLTACSSPAPLATIEPPAAVPALASLEDTAAPERVEVEAALVEIPPERSTWSARRGESLAHYARWSELPVESIAEASGIGLHEAVPVGATIVVPGGEAIRGKVAAARERHHLRRAEGYLDRRGGALGTTFYTVRTGDTAWRVANDELGVPLWLLETYNPHVDLERLRPGQELMAPLLADTVAEAPTPDSPAAP